MKVTIIGLGHQSLKDHIPAILESDKLTLDSVCDISLEIVNKVASQYSVKGFTSLEKLIQEAKPSIAIVCVPHNMYPKIIEILALAKINILKEKPFAISIQEAEEYHSLIKKTGIKMMVGVQRKFHPIFQTFNQLKARIGKICHIEAKYATNIERLDEGWRASFDFAGGGALIDMGYHYIDLLLWYFGLPDSLSASITLKNREGQIYDVEDTIIISFEFFDEVENHKKIGSLLVSRINSKKEEFLSVVGSKGAIHLTRGLIKLLDKKGNEIESLERNKSWLSAYINQIESFADAITNNLDCYVNDYKSHFKHIAFIEAAYLAAKKNQVVSPKNIYRTITPNDI